ncbi:MAG: hypothetical protein HYV37_01665 [Candidatus Levyibacteriota bacterium]|nr:MAG: hypothetical protein HYV37_01665 [Candidatus Levybacteria bacterium]
MIKNKIKEHIFYYFSLLSVVILGVFLTLQFPGNKQIQMMTIVITTFFYVGFGIVHHRENHNLSAKIVVEYMLIGALGMTIASFFLLGS